MEAVLTGAISTKFAVDERGVLAVAEPLLHVMEGLQVVRNSIYGNARSRSTR